MRPGPLLSIVLCFACSSTIGDPPGGSPGPGANEPGGSGTPGPGMSGGGSMPGQLPPPVAVPGPAGSDLEKACKVRDAGPSPVRRLTRWEYDNTVRDLLGDTTGPAGRFPPDERGAGFTNDAQNLSVSPLHVENYLDAAERLVTTATVDLGKLVPCDPANGDAACATRFLETWGKRAWRRPLDDEEKAAMLKVFTAGMTEGFATGIRMMMQVMLQVPQFLYRVETGGAKVGTNMVEADPLGDGLAPVVSVLGHDARQRADGRGRGGQAGHQGRDRRPRRSAWSATIGPSRPWPPSTTSGWTSIRSRPPRRTPRCSPPSRPPCPRCSSARRSCSWKR